MAKPDRAARVAGRFLLPPDDEVLARAIRRECKRAVEEEREACAHIAGSLYGHVRGSAEIAAAIRARPTRSK